MSRYIRVTPLLLSFVVLASAIVVATPLVRGGGEEPAAVDLTTKLFQRIEALENRVAVLEKGPRTGLWLCTASAQSPQEQSRPNVQITSPYQPTYQPSYQPAAPSPAPMPYRQ